MYDTSYTPARGGWTFLLMLMAAACGDAGTGLEEAVITLNPITDTLTVVGQQTTATAEVRDRKGNVLSGVRIVWTTSDASIATVSSQGVVTAAGSGTAMIRAGLPSSTDSTPIVVDQEVTDVEITARFDTLFALGVRARLTATATDSGGAIVPASHEAPAWYVTDSTLASIDSEGRLTPLAAGTVTAGVHIGGQDATTDLVVAPLGALAIDVALAEQLQWALEDALPATDTFGVTGTVITADGSEWNGASGWSGPGKRLRPDANIALGSIAKSVAGSVLLSVIDAGLVGIDDTIGDWLDTLTNVPPGAGMRHILNNSSGITDYQLHPDFGATVFADTSRVWTIEELVDMFTPPPEFPVGERYSSSLTGFALAVLVAMAATGDDYPTLLNDRVLTPLGLNDAFYLQGQEPEPTTFEPGWFMDNTGLIVEFSQFFSTSLITSRGLGSMLASTSGIARFTRALVGGDLLNPALTDEVLTAIPDDGRIPGQDGAGLALRRYNYLGGRQWGHSGVISNGSGMVFHEPESGITVAVLFNINSRATANVHFALLPQMLGFARDAATAGVGSRE